MLHCVPKSLLPLLFPLHFESVISVSISITNIFGRDIGEREFFFGLFTNRLLFAELFKTQKGDIWGHSV